MRKSNSYLHPLIYLFMFFTIYCFGWLKAGPTVAWIIVTHLAMFHLLHAIIWEAWELEL